MPLFFVILHPSIIITKTMTKISCKKWAISLFSWLSCFLMPASVMAQETASLKIDAQTLHQRITGFGGFVCSPSFAYGHMNDADIKKVWGPQSTVGCNIMRLYIPIGKNSWSQSLSTAKKAKQMGLIVFASPWGQPAEWKTNGTSNAKNSDGTTGKLKRENWPDYAKYLDDYVTYLRQNGVELDAISIQNEPDWPATYAGCLWSAAAIGEFVRLYGRQINCKIIAPETLAVSDSYANELAKTAVLPCFDIYGGHQYGGIQSAYKKLGKQGKQLWMTEYLINWNENSSSNRNFNYDKDVFDFARSINTCMLNDFNAWIHYAAKRYYAMLGDGTMGTQQGVVTKRGYVMAHFAKYATGLTRVGTSWNDDAAQPLEGSAYLSDGGDTLVAVVFNAGKSARKLIVDLPFYTQKGEMVSTTKTKNMAKTELAYDENLCRPVVVIEASSVATIRFVKSRDRQVSQMKGSATRFDKIDDMERTKTAFGTTYRMSGKTIKFDHSNPLISNKTNDASGYVLLNDRYSQLVMQVKKVTSTLNYTSANTTLYYINDEGTVTSHNYGELDLTAQQNFNLVLDLSPNTLKDGCRGLVSITNNNWSSTLSITFGDVYLSNGRQFAANVSGDFVADDSFILDYTSDEACTSLDLSSVTSFSDEDMPRMANQNAVVYLKEGVNSEYHNAVIGDWCPMLSLKDDAGAFRPYRPFEAARASFTCKIEGMRMLMLPFSAAIPQNVRAYSLTDETSSAEPCFRMTMLEDSIPAYVPVVVEGDGEVVFSGEGEVSAFVSPLSDVLRGSFSAVPLYKGDYVLVQQEGKWGFAPLSSDKMLLPFGAYAHLSSQQTFIPLSEDASGIHMVTSVPSDLRESYFDLQGRQLQSKPSHSGMYIYRSADGKARKIWIE